jgi:hypothetical protein
MPTAAPKLEVTVAGRLDSPYPNVENSVEFPIAVLLDT